MRCVLRQTSKANNENLKKSKNRGECYWLYTVTNYNVEPKLMTVKDTVALAWQPIQKAQHYTLDVRAITQSR